MKSILIYYTPTFAKRFKKLPKNIKAKAVLKEKVFKKNPFDRSLKTHKLTGKLKDYWSFSVEYHYRIIFRFISKTSILFLDIGTHEAYRN